MEHDGSRVAADLSHEGSRLIRNYGEPGRQGSNFVRACMCCISEARKPSTLAGLEKLHGTPLWENGGRLGAS